MNTEQLNTSDSGQNEARVDLPTTAPTAALEGGEGGKQGSQSPSSPPCPAEPVANVAAEQGDDIYRPAPATDPVVTALKTAGLYRNRIDTRRHAVICPWTVEHGTGDARTATYVEAAPGERLGRYVCPCSHQRARSLHDLLEQLHLREDKASAKPRIRAQKGEIHRIVDRAEQILRERCNLYRSSGQIVSLQESDGDGDIKIVPATEQALAIHLSANCDWETFNSRAGQWVRSDVPASVVSNLYRNTTLSGLPVVIGAARQPYICPQTKALVTKPGYNADARIYAAFQPNAFKLLGSERDKAETALGMLKGLLDEFEFAHETDQSATLSAMLTAAIRGSLKVAPAFNIAASSPGSGKSYLASIIAPFAGPGEARNISYPSTQEEATKVVLSLALEQPAVVCFDDMPTDWLPHGAMNRMLTSGTITERLLGSNRVVTGRASSFIMGTGNNIRPLRDMARRVASIYLEPQAETAATRSFEDDPAQRMRTHRTTYVSAALTIIQAWIAAGQPKADVPNIAGFEDWSDLCRHSLIWLGEPDPATSLIQQMTHDPDKEQLGDLLRAWRAEFGDRSLMVRQVLKRAEDRQNDDLFSAIMELPCVESGRINQSRFGRYLGRNKNRIVNGLKLVEVPNSERRAWAVQSVTAMPQSYQPYVEASGPIESTWQRSMTANDIRRAA